MIETTLLEDGPIVLQRVFGFGDASDVAVCVEQALQVVAQATSNHGCFDLILDFRGDSSAPQYSLQGHRAWAKGFKENPAVKHHGRRTVVVADDSEKFRAEKAAMETNSLRFCTDFDEGLAWLRGGT